MLAFISAGAIFGFLLRHESYDAELDKCHQRYTVYTLFSKWTKEWV